MSHCHVGCPYTRAAGERPRTRLCWGHVLLSLCIPQAHPIPALGWPEFRASEPWSVSYCLFCEKSFIGTRLHPLLCVARGCFPPTAIVGAENVLLQGLLQEMPDPCPHCPSILPHFAGRGVVQVLTRLGLSSRRHRMMRSV